MSWNCGSCGSCDSDCTAPEYINAEGYHAVLCPACETEIIIVGNTPSKKIVCEECGTVIEVVPVQLN
ncbi:MAG: hypothetical protein K6T66_05175 [Peptococcaceae bacterium]|nr:hypothetical protein [Peptococcaceae bacterium]